MIDVSAITRLHRDMVVLWHHQPIDNPHEGLLRIVCEQFSYNFRLWHAEDVARSPDAGDGRIAEVKRDIDRHNQCRNDAIERIDDWITEWLETHAIAPPLQTPLNTETPGSAIDRLSIMTLRIYHLEEQLQRLDVTDEHIRLVDQRLLICREQHRDLSRSLAELANDIAAGRKRHKTYRQLKMYNDPRLNPHLYRVRLRAS